MIKNLIKFYIKYLGVKEIIYLLKLMVIYFEKGGILRIVFKKYFLKNFLLKINLVLKNEIWLELVLCSVDFKRF